MFGFIIFIIIALIVIPGAPRIFGILLFSKSIIASLFGFAFVAFFLSFIFQTIKSIICKITNNEKTNHTKTTKQETI